MFIATSLYQRRAARGKLLLDVSIYGRIVAAQDRARRR
jgi:hypothetical protein